jgi:type IV pilus assembly protein PilA
MTHGQRGFTLIELMIVIAILGLLTAIALPAYSDYSLRARMSEVILNMTAVRSRVTEYYSLHAAMPTTAAEAGLDTGVFGNYVASSELLRKSDTIVKYVMNIEGLDDGKIVPGTSNRIAFQGEAGANGSVTWFCGPDTTNPVAEVYLPISCRDTIVAVP